MVLAIRRGVSGKYPEALLKAHFDEIMGEMRSGLDADSSGDITVLEYHFYTEKHDLLTKFGLLWKAAEKVRRMSHIPH